MEDLTTQFDGTVRDAKGNIVQFHYGEDGVNSTKIENTSLGLTKLSDDDIRRDYGMNSVDLSSVLDDGVIRGDDQEVLTAFAEQIISDRNLVIEKVYRGKLDGSLFAPVNLERAILNIKVKE